MDTFWKQVGGLALAVWLGVMASIVTVAVVGHVTSAPANENR